VNFNLTQVNFEFSTPCLMALNIKLEQEGGTFLEDFLQSIELLPNDVRRNFDLMRELDRDSGDAIRDCADS